jgi:aryl-alcohol dehydrogenase-like predicted oxidoreductase
MFAICHGCYSVIRHEPHFLPSALAAVTHLCPRHDPPLEVGPEPALSRQQIHEACEASLKRLNTTYIDLYQLHWCVTLLRTWTAAAVHHRIPATSIADAAPP